MSDCTHPTRYTAQDGRNLCEECARKEAGWKQCRSWGCIQTVPPEMKRCDVHRGTDTECESCAGEGYVNCEEMDCHGEFCDRGEAECQECDGTGTTAKPLVASA